MANNNHRSKLDVMVMYKECLHNHAAQARGYILDGCGLFEAGGPNGTPESAVCAACHCHRNFHRRVVVDLPPGDYDTRTENEIPQQTSTSHTPSPAPSPTTGRQNRTQLLPVSAPASQSADVPVQETGPTGRRKRITRAQSERIRAVAESNDWKMFREYSKEEVEHICSEIGITRVTLKGWIFNHRQKRGTNNADLN